MGAFSRDKGKRVELQIAKVLEIFFGTKVRRRLGQERDSGEDLDSALPFTFEVKARKSPAGVQKYLEQAAAAHRENEIPVAIIKANNQKPIVVMYLNDFCTVTVPYVAEVEKVRIQRDMTESNDWPEHRGSRRAGA